MFVANNPVDFRVAANSVVLRVNKDNFVEFVRSVLANPVGVKNTEVSTFATNSLFSERLVGLGLLELANTVVSWLSEYFTFANISLTTTASNTDAVDYVALSSLVAKSSGLVDSTGS
jgi:hypothetical protein